MTLTHSQKKFIKRNIKTLSAPEASEKLGLSDGIVLDYLQSIWKKEKYEKYVMGMMNIDISHSELEGGGGFDFKVWIKENKFILLGLSLLAFIVYVNGLNSGFVSDDIGGILNNSLVGDLGTVFSSPAGLAHRFYLYIGYQIGGLNPFYYRLMNLLFHIATISTVYLLFDLMWNKKLAIIVSVLFAVHPILVESITWIAGGSYPEYSFFFLVSFVLFLMYQRDKKYYILSVFFFILSLLTSEKSVVLILVFVSYVVIFLKMNYSAANCGVSLWESSFRTIHPRSRAARYSGSKIKKHCKELIPYVLSAVVFVWIALSRVGMHVSTLQSDHYQDSGLDNPLIQIPIAITEYFKLIFWPMDLTLYHSEMSFSKEEYLVRLGIFLIFIGVIIYSYWRVRKKNIPLMFKFWKEVPATTSEILDQRLNDYKFIFFWLMFFLISLSPTLTPFRISWIVAERYIYLGSIGIFAVVGFFVSKLAEVKGFKNYVYTVFAVAIIALSIRTIVRNRDWKNEDTLWIATAKTSPSSPNTHNNMGDVYGRGGDLANSVKEFQIAIEIKPNYADAYHNLANTYQQMAQVALSSENQSAYGYTSSELTEMAVENYKNAIKYNPNLWQSYQNLGVIYFNKGDYENSAKYIEISFKINPTISMAYNLALVYSKIERNEEARLFLTQILLSDPNNQQAQSLLHILSMGEVK